MSENTTIEAGRHIRLDPKPLYMQVRENLIARLLNGEWRPGDALPSETQLAQDYNVSQGTVRKAIDAMTAENLITRRQGKGSFVNSHVHKHKPFRFYRLFDHDGRPAVTETQFLHCVLAGANKDDEKAFGAQAKGVVDIHRLRSIGGRPAILEHIRLRTDLCPGLDVILEQLRPASIYSVLEKHYNILILRVSERVHAQPADFETAQILDISEATPVIRVERRAFSLDGQVIERRDMLARPDLVYYAGQGS